MNVFAGGRALLDAAFSYAGEEVEYWRGRARVAACVAKPARTTFSADAHYSRVNLRFCQKDWLVRAAELPAGFVPATGDEIRSGCERWLVLAPAGEPVWRDHSPGVLRIHAKRVTPTGAA